MPVWQRFESVARAHGDAPAILQGERICSFSRLRADALSWAAALDLGPGERVVVAGANGAVPAAAILGAWARGALPVLVHADAPAQHIAHAAERTAASVVLTDREGLGQMTAPVMPLAPPAPAPYEPRPLRSAHEPASILFTSGSTGRPKGVVQTAASLLSGADRIAGLLGLSPSDRILCPVPFAFDYGWGQLLSTVLGGVPLVLPEPAGAFGTCDALGRHAPTVLAAIPAALSDLLSGLAPIRETERGSVRLVTNTGARIPERVFEALLETFPEAAISLNYGLTETYRSASLPPALAREMPGCVGPAVPGADIAVMRPDGTRAEPGEEGEIVHRGAGAFAGYWGDPEATARVLRPDPLWRHDGIAAPPAVFTGDLGHLDAEGRLFVHGRRDRLMKVMGVRVSPDEVEALVMASGEALAAAVTSLPHEMLGDRIVAAVVPRPGAEPAACLKALKAHARATMSPYMQPRTWHLVEALPRTPSGKTDYPGLRRMAEAPS